MTAPLKIGIVCFPTFGGSGVVATELARTLADRGHDVHVISQAPPVRLRVYQPNLSYHEVPVFEYPLFEAPLYALHAAATLANLAEYIRLDIVHAHYALPHAVSAYLARVSTQGKGFKIVTTLHGTDITLLGRDPSFFPITRFAIRQSDAVTSVSRYLQSILAEDYGIPEPRVRVIPNFVDLDTYKPPPEDPRPEGDRCLVHVSNFRPVKRTLDVLQVFERLLPRYPSRLIMVGDGPDRILCERYCLQRGIQDSVRFVGKQDDLVPILQKASLFILPSEIESFGLAALEAMSCGVPVIATRVGGVPELIRSGEEGYLFEVGDVEGMAQQALDLLHNPAEWRRMSRNARRRAEQFDRHRIVRRYESLYESLVET